ncbi:MAG: hypothetical protein ACUVUE_06215 [Candidatus Bathycorpusculaceae bacterium]
MVELRKLNWFGIASGVAAAVLLLLSIAYAAPWWQLSIAEGLGKVDVSPLDINAQFLGLDVEIPILWYLTLSGKLIMLTAIVALFACSICPENKYAKNLLSYGYKRPLIMVTVLVVILIILTALVGLILPIKVPFLGTETTTLTFEGAKVSVPIYASFTWVFWLAIITAALAVLARVYHRRIAPLA